MSLLKQKLDTKIEILNISSYILGKCMSFGSDIGIVNIMKVIAFD